MAVRTMKPPAPPASPASPDEEGAHMIAHAHTCVLLCVCIRQCLRDACIRAPASPAYSASPPAHEPASQMTGAHSAPAQRCAAHPAPSSPLLAPSAQAKHAPAYNDMYACTRTCKYAYTACCCLCVRACFVRVCVGCICICMHAPPTLRHSQAADARLP